MGPTGTQKFTLSVDVEGGRLVLLRRQRDSQEDWTTFTHDRSEPGPNPGWAVGWAPWVCGHEFLSPPPSHSSDDLLFFLRTIGRPFYLGQIWPHTAGLGIVP